jgi:hypothetical protein
MLDRENMVPLLKELTSRPTLGCIRIDTNASWDPGDFKEVDASKIILMCTYHPRHVSMESFLARIERLEGSGYKIGMVNFVMDRDNITLFKKIQREVFSRGIPLHPNPLWDPQGRYTKEDLAILKEELPDADYRYRTQAASPYGNKCLFPAVAYQMNQNGRIHVGCHPQVSGSIFDPDLPRTFPGPVPCPNKSCMCLDMYSFLEDVNRNTDVNPLLVYSDVLKNRYAVRDS